MKVTVYKKPSCVQCDATIRALNTKGIEHETVDLTEDAASMELVLSLGYRQAPVVISGDLHWAGFRPDMIAKLEVEPSLSDLAA